AFRVFEYFLLAAIKQRPRNLAFHLLHPAGSGYTASPYKMHQYGFSLIGHVMSKTDIVVLFRILIEYSPPEYPCRHLDAQLLHRRIRRYVYLPYFTPYTVSAADIGYKSRVGTAFFPDPVTYRDYI